VSKIVIILLINLFQAYVESSRSNSQGQAKIAALG